MRGRFISFEGIDGAGKSTHISALAQALRERGLPVVLTREPGGTPLAETLRELVLHQPMGALTEALLLFAARKDHIDAVIEPALARGDWVLCDRFTDATFAYQGFGRQFDLESLSLLEHLVQENWRHPVENSSKSLLQPDLTVWFDVSPEIAAARLASARVPDKFESQPQAFFAAVRSGYADRAAKDPGRFARIDADAERDLVWQQVQAAAAQRDWWPK